MTKKQIIGYYRKWKNTPIYYDLWYVYKRPSQAKLNAYKEIVDKCYYANGIKPVVLTHNTSMFTMGYAIGDTFYVETPTQTAAAKISELEN